MGLRKQLKSIQKRFQVDSVSVPTNKNKKCTLRHMPFRGWKSIPFETLMDVIEFALENTLVKDIRDGQLWRQSVGIPMGDPHSPGMTIGTCAWMEDEWMQTIDEETKRYFRMKRYMDDVLSLYCPREASLARLRFSPLRASLNTPLHSQCSSTGHLDAAGVGS